MKLRMKVIPRLILISSVITPKTTTGALAPVVVLGWGNAGFHLSETFLQTGVDSLSGVC
ncbi:hypothetical protein ABIE61_003339, partial [Marinobacterium sp. MBR-111]